MYLTFYYQEFFLTLDLIVCRQKKGLNLSVKSFFFISFIAA